MGQAHQLCCFADVLLKGKRRAIKHYARVQAEFDHRFDQFEVFAVIKMKSDWHFGLCRDFDHGVKIVDAAVFQRAFGSLNDDRRFFRHRGVNNRLNHLQVVDVKRPHGVVAGVGFLEHLFGRDKHRSRPIIRLDGPDPKP